MKRLAATIISIMSVISINASDKPTHEIALGLHNNEYVFAEYTYRNRWSLQLENSVFFSGVGNQYLRIAAGYKSDFGKLRIKVAPQFGFNYGMNYHNFGLRAAATMKLSFFQPFAQVMPYYDSGFDYSTCYSAGAAFHVIDEVALGAYASNIPEYRTVENKLKIFARFQVKRLNVTPELSLPFKNGKQRCQILVNFRYSLPLNNKRQR